MSIRDTIQRAAIGLMTKVVPDAPPDRLIGKHGSLGTFCPRIDGPSKVRGKARFAAEVPAERLTYAALLYSTIGRGRIVNPSLTPNPRFIVTNSQNTAEIRH